MDIEKHKTTEEFNKSLIKTISLIIMEHLGEKTLSARHLNKSKGLNNSKLSLKDKNIQVYIEICEELQKQLLLYQRSNFLNYDEYIKSPNLKRLNELSKKSRIINKSYAKFMKRNPLKSINDFNVGGEAEIYFEYVKNFYNFIKDEKKIKFDDQGRIVVELNGNKIDDLMIVIRLFLIFFMAEKIQNRNMKN